MFEGDDLRSVLLPPDFVSAHAYVVFRFDVWKVVVYWYVLCCLVVVQFPVVPVPDVCYIVYLCGLCTLVAYHGLEVILVVFIFNGIVYVNAGFVFC